MWQATPPAITAGEALFQSDGIYNPSTNITTWNVPYLSNLKVGSLSAITTNTGNLTVSGTIQSNTAAISGTTMTGSGGVLYSTGNFAFGNSATNISFNGTQMTLNGNVVATGNINANAVTNTLAAYTSSNVTIGYSNIGTGWTTVQTLTINSTGAPIVIWGNSNLYLGDTTSQPINSRFGYARILKDSSTVIYSNQYGSSVNTSQRIQAVVGPLIDIPTSGSHTYEYQIQITGYISPDFSFGTPALATFRSLVLMELKK